MFFLFAVGAPAPVPLSLVARVLGVQKNSREVKEVRRCALLSRLTKQLGDIETVSVHHVTRDAFQDLFLMGNSTSPGKAN